MEVMMSLSILFFVCMTTIPLMVTVYKERLTIQEELHHLYTVDEARQRYIIDLPPSDDSIQKLQVKKGVVQFCTRWTGTNERTYERCLLAGK